ncbi:TIGR01777 family protein [Synechocystis sp. PCC 7339]|uniref:thylakoid membrane protein ThyD n=1 Tax=unclassified Synechocystis TaxID=2640012 RepID=UPI001BB0AD20|nr:MULTISPECIES: TIGR01777 family oxidoreductase [unclassified Synechocystis]QUS61224.1 TIGR01777 family protein [Synechocystis sp. PCC 7338]UAJ73412.1 TIGR01777 family protein [Synechocystis sp. PCC 7339]
MKIILTGVTGFVGRSLVPLLHQQGHELTLLVRSVPKAQRLFPPSSFPQLTTIAYEATESGPWQEQVNGQDAVINLAGEPISERWTEAYKTAIFDSRKLGTEKLVEAIAKAERKPKVMISGSAIGYYGTSETETFTESSDPGDDFLAEVCQAWENAAHQVEFLGVRLVIFRIGIVLGADGGALNKMLPPFKLFAGGPLGSGEQWFSWIDRQDLVALIDKALTDSTLRGTYNATAPNPVKMKEFCDTLGKVLARPSWLPVPDIALELLLGEAAKLVLEGQQVLPEAIAKADFEYQAPTLEASLRQILAS